MFRGHGGPGRIAFYDEEGSWIGRIAVNASIGSDSRNRYIESCSKNQLASLRCVMYIGCNTGLDYVDSSGAHNLVQATFEKGAHFVLGTTETVVRSDSDAKSLADEFVLSMLGADILSAFNDVSVKADTSGLFSYVVNYTRLTKGHKTDEVMTVFIDKSGTIVGYNGYNVCKYDALKDEFVDKAIDSAKATLISKINDLCLNNLEMQEPIITTNADGALYVRIDFSYQDDYGIICSETVLVSIY